MWPGRVRQGFCPGLSRSPRMSPEKAAPEPQRSSGIFARQRAMWSSRGGVSGLMVEIASGSFFQNRRHHAHLALPFKRSLASCHFI